MILNEYHKKKTKKNVSQPYLQIIIKHGIVSSLKTLKITIKKNSNNGIQQCHFFVTLTHKPIQHP